MGKINPIIQLTKTKYLHIGHVPSYPHRKKNERFGQSATDPQIFLSHNCHALDNKAKQESCQWTEVQHIKMSILLQTMQGNTYQEFPPQLDELQKGYSGRPCKP